mgnify:CR=1 FL=1
MKKTDAAKSKTAKKTLVGNGWKPHESLACCCAGVFVLTCLLLAVMQPPMVMQRKNEPHQSPRVSAVAVLSWGFVAAGATGALAGGGE